MCESACALPGERGHAVRFQQLVGDSDTVLIPRRLYDEIIGFASKSSMYIARLRFSTLAGFSIGYGTIF
jgi:hypothetical protein